MDESAISTLTLLHENGAWTLRIYDVPLKLEKDYHLKDIAKFVHVQADPTQKVKVTLYPKSNLEESIPFLFDLQEFKSFELALGQINDLALPKLLLFSKADDLMFSQFWLKPIKSHIDQYSHLKALPKEVITYIPVQLTRQGKTSLDSFEIHGNQVRLKSTGQDVKHLVSSFT